MGKKRVGHSAEFKAKVALEALKGLKNVNELAGSISDADQPMEAASARGSTRTVCRSSWEGRPRVGSRSSETVRRSRTLEDGVGLDKKNCRAWLTSNSSGLCRDIRS